MFHEFHDLTTEMKASDRYLRSLSGMHRMLDQKIGNMAVCTEQGVPDEIRVVKNKKRAIKAGRYTLLQPISLARTGS